jgi:hypothetical protein
MTRRSYQPRRRSLPGWVKSYAVPSGSKGDVWSFGGSGWTVRHCGHPTANYPWAGYRADGSPLPGCFVYLVDAQQALELAFYEQRVRDLGGVVIQRAIIGRAP